MLSTIRLPEEIEDRTRTVTFHSPQSAATRINTPEMFTTASDEKYLGTNGIDFETLRQEFTGTTKLPGLTELMNIKTK